MADRSHLTPVTVTDRNGRSTTVYRRNEAKLPAAPSSRSVPALPPAPRGGGEDTPLPAPKPLPAEEVERLATYLAEGTYTRIMGLRYTLTGERAGRSAVELAVELAQAGTITESEANSILVLCVDRTSARKGAVLALDCLRVAARLSGRWPDRGRRWPDDLIAAVVGAQIGQSKRVSTTAQLDSLAAVVQITMLKASARAIVEVAYRDGNEHHRIRNRDLNALLRERPHDLDRIIAYVEERGVPLRTDAPVTALRGWLEGTDTTRPLANGWL